MTGEVVTLDQAERDRRKAQREDRERDGGGGGGGGGDGQPPPDTGPMPDCPVVALGQRAGKYFFTSPSGEFRTLDARGLTATGILSLFDSQTVWLEAAAPAPRKRGSDMSWSPVRAATILIRMCAEVGLYDEAMPKRGPGVWPAGGAFGDSPLVVHVGNELLVESGTLKPGGIYGRILYPAYPKIGRPADRPWSQGSELLLECLQLWNVPDLTRDLFVGWLGQAFIGAAHRWRAHMLLAGPRGGGKTAFVSFTNALLGGMAKQLNSYTEAGLRQMMNDESRAVLLDEAEGGTLTIEPVIVMLRQMSTGLQGVRGSAGGHSVSYSVTASALLAAINPPVLEPADRSRILEVELGRLPKFATARYIGEAIEWAEKTGPAWWMRCLVNYPIFVKAFAKYVDALQAAGCDNRQADQLATLLAGRDLLLFTEPPTEDQVQRQIRVIEPLIMRVRSLDDLESDPKLCLGRLYTAQVEHWRGGSKSTIGRLIEGALRGDSEPRAALAVYGVRFETINAAPYLYVAGNHSGLSRIYHGTRWQNGGWVRSLSRLEAAEMPDASIRFGGHKARYVKLDKRHLPIEGGDPPDIDPPPAEDPSLDPSY